MELILLVVISRLCCIFVKQICLEAPMETIEEYFNSKEIVEGQIMKIIQLSFPFSFFSYYIFTFSPTKLYLNEKQF